jgi:hypothetical protein
MNATRMKASGVEPSRMSAPRVEPSSMKASRAEASSTVCHHAGRGNGAKSNDSSAYNECSRH